MARRAKYNTEGALIMGAAGIHSKIFGCVELAERTGIPYQTLHKRLAEDFGSTSFNNLKALIKATGMTDTEIILLMRGKA